MRDYQVQGAYLVMVKFGSHVVSGYIPGVTTPATPLSGLSPLSGTFVPLLPGSEIPTGLFGVSGTTAIPGVFTGTVQGVTIPGLVPTPFLYELGLPEGKIIISPKLIHKDVVIDEFGPDSAADVRTLCHEVKVDMTLIHYDQWVLDTVKAESMGGGQVAGGFAGTLPPAGHTLGRGLAPGSSGCHFMSLSLFPTIFGGVPWRFPTAYLTSDPLEIPIGTEKSMVRLVWRGIAYTQYDGNAPGDNELPTSGLVLWDHGVD